MPTAPSYLVGNEITTFNNNQDTVTLVSSNNNNFVFKLETATGQYPISALDLPTNKWVGILLKTQPAPQKIILNGELVKKQEIYSSPNDEGTIDYGIIHWINKDILPENIVLSCPGYQDITITINNYRTHNVDPVNPGHGQIGM